MVEGLIAGSLVRACFLGGGEEREQGAAGLHSGDNQRVAMLEAENLDRLQKKVWVRIISFQGVP